VAVITTPTPPTYVTVRTAPEDIERASKKRSPPLPFDTGWRPPSLAGIEHLMLKGNSLASMVGPRITRAQISQTLDEPLGIQIDVWDKGRDLLTSGLLDSKIRVALSGQAYLLTRVAKNGDLLTLEFEDANVNKLRDFTDPVKVTRGTMSRIEFVKKLLSEKGAPKLQWLIDAGRPGSVTVERNPLALRPHQERKPGPWKKTTVKNVQADADQLDNMEVVLGHLFHEPWNATRDELIMVCMCVTQESTWRNSAAHTDHDSEGLFQQRASVSTWDGGGTNRKRAAELFLQQLRKAEATGATTEKTLLIAAVQNPRKDLYRKYEQWQDESQKTISAWNRAFGGSQSPVATHFYEFRRGNLDGTLESTWECLGRLADEVQYRRFIIDNVFYFLPDELLVGTGPRLLLSETSHGMMTSIDFDTDEQVDPQTCTFSIRSEDWSVPVGACIETENLGPGNGVWLVNKVAGDLLVPHIQDIELVRPRAVLTEPPADQTVDLSRESGGGRSPATGASNTDQATSDALTPMSAEQQLVVDEARTWLGVPYVYGGESRSGADCSGFAMAVYQNALGITIPRVAKDQWAARKTSTDKSGILPADEVFFNWPPEDPPGHCGIYLGGGDFIEAPKPGGHIKIVNLDAYIRQGAQWYGYNRPWSPGGIGG
jgi:cell wall-associated NlpC family hydrolase